MKKRSNALLKCNEKDKRRYIINQKIYYNITPLSSIIVGLINPLVREKSEMIQYKSRLLLYVEPLLSSKRISPFCLDTKAIEQFIACLASLVS